MLDYHIKQFASNRHNVDNIVFAKYSKRLSSDIIKFIQINNRMFDNRHIYIHIIHTNYALCR